MPFGSGRKLCHEWKEVIRDEDTGKVICKHCDSAVSAKVERIRSHLANCKEFSSKELLTSRDKQSVLNSDEPSTSVSSTLSSKQDHVIKRKQSSVTEFVVKTTAEQQEKLDYSVAKFFYSNNIAFNAASSKEYKEMIEALRPGYVGPDRKRIAGDLLNKAAEEVDEGIKIQLEKKLSTITLLQDGWSTVQNDPIIATCIHTGQNTALLDAVDCESRKKTSEFCLDLIEKSIERCEKLYKKEVFAVCTDNEPKMVKMRELLSKKHETIIAYGCSAHYINLLEEEITPKDILKHVVEVQKYFRNHHQPHGWLKEKNGRMPQIPNATRWNSNVECLRTFNENYSKYVEIDTENEGQLPNNISKILSNVAIYRESVHLNRQLSYIGDILDKFQTDDTNIAQAVELWLNLLENPDFGSYKHLIRRRMDQALQPCHFLANLLDPRYQGIRLTEKHEETAENWLITYNPDWLPCLMSFRIKDDIYPSSLFSDSVIQTLNPAKWWLLMDTKCAKKDFPKDFCLFAKNLMNCPASSAGIERVFSSYGLVWSDLRNKLGKDTAEKLVKVYRHLRSNK